MNKSIGLIIVFCLLTVSVLQAQNKWNLEECINYGLAHSLLVEQARLAEKNADISVKSAVHQRFPSLSAGSSLTYSIGRSIDPTTNDFITSDFLSNGISLSSGIVLFDGLRIHNSVKRSIMDQRAAREDVRQWERDVAMNVASAYLAILFATENLENAVNQFNGTNEQLEKVNKLITAGARPVSDRFDLEAQLALDEQNVVRMQNDLRKTYLDLRNIIRYEEAEELQIVVPSLAGLELSDPEQWELEELYVRALNHQPAIEAGEYRIKSARYDLKIAKSSYYPSLGLGGSLSTNYSDQAFEATNVQQVYNPINVLLNGQEVTVGFPDYTFDKDRIPYFNQIEDNIGLGAGVQLSIPIYSNYQNKAAVSRAKLNLKNTEISNELEKQQLKSNINLALANAISAKQQLIAARKSAEALEVSFRNAAKRFELGQIGSYEYLDIKNKLDNARTNVLIARYDFVFSQKVIEFYIGLPLNF